jgi:hypothetical protein
VFTYKESLSQGRSQELIFKLPLVFFSKKYADKIH